MKICEKDKELKGSLHFQILDKDGNVIRAEAVHNLIVSQGRNNLARLLGGQTGMHVTQFGLGTGSTAAASADTGLTDTLKFDLIETRIGTGLEAEDGSTFDDPKAIQFFFRVGLEEAVGMNIFEYGLFCADETLFSRIVRPSVMIKSNLEQIRGFWQIQF